VVLGRKGIVLSTCDLCTKSVNSGVSGSGVGAAPWSGLGIEGRRKVWYVLGLRSQLPEDERIGNHVVDIVTICAKHINDSARVSRMHPLSVSEVGKRTLLVDDPHSGLLRPDPDALDVIGGVSESLELVVEGVGDLNSGLGMEFGREGDLEENVLHDVRSIRALELERLALEENVVEAPGLGSQY